MRAFLEGLLCDGVDDSLVLRAFKQVNRRDFLPEGYAATPFLDENVPVGKRSVVLSPVVLAKMVHFGEGRRQGRALDLGFATGYSSTVLSFIYDEVVALESSSYFVESFRKKFQKENVKIFRGRLRDGYSKLAPYAMILCNGKVDSLSLSLLEQLDEEGVLLAIMEDKRGSYACAWKRKGDNFARRRLFSTNAPYLSGFEKVEKFTF